MAAAVFTREGMAVGDPHNSELSYPTRDLPEGATQIFDTGSPVVLTGGFVVSAADPVTAIHGVAVDFAKNAAADGDVDSKVVELTPRGRTMIASLIEAADADHVLLDTDLGSEVGLSVGTLPNTTTAWFAEVGGTGFTVVSFHGDQVPKDRTDSRGLAGDTNARVLIQANADILSTA